MENHEDTNKSDRKDGTLRLFITGLPVPLDLEQFISSLAFYGTFEIDQARYEKSLRRGRNKGCLSVMAGDNISFNRLLSDQNYIFQSRTLAIMPFKTGFKLQEMSKMISNCKVIVKKVPLNMPDDILTDLISKKCGAIKFIFQFKRYEPSEKKKSPGRFKTYSVLMEYEAVARSMVAIGSLHIDSKVTLQFLPFNPTHKEKGCQKNMLGGTLDWTHHLSLEHETSTNCMRQTTHIDQIPTRRSKPAEARSGQANWLLSKSDIDLRDQILLKPLSDCRLYLKPTQRGYHSTASDRYDLQHAMQLIRNRSLAESNIRINIKSR